MIPLRLTKAYIKGDFVYFNANNKTFVVNSKDIKEPTEAQKL